MKLSAVVLDETRRSLNDRSSILRWLIRELCVPHRAEGKRVTRETLSRQQK